MRAVDTNSPESFEAFARRVALAAVEELMPEIERRGLPVRPEWLSPEQASVYCGFAVDSLSQMRRRGGGPPFTKVGHLIRYRRSDIDSWIESHAVKGAR